MCRDPSGEKSKSSLPPITQCHEIKNWRARGLFQVFKNRIVG